jgi:hypothetical protein
MELRRIHEELGVTTIHITNNQDVYISDVLPPGPSVNRYKGLITTIETNSTVAIVNVIIGKIILKAEIPGGLAGEISLAPKKEIYLILKLRRLKVLGNRESNEAHHCSWYYQEIM